MKKFNLITFDVSGTLLTFNKSIGEIYCEAAKAFGITAEPTVVTDRNNKYVSEMSQHHPNYGLSSGIGWQKWWKMVVSKSFDCIEDYNERSKDLEQLSDVLIENFNKRKEWKVIDGSIDLLEYLRNKGIHTGVISNFDPRLHKILEDVGIRKYFSFVITSYEAGFMKPDECIFKEAEKKFINLGNKFDRSKTIHIGDSFEYDYCGAKNAGWNAMLIDPLAEKYNLESSSSIFKNLYELKEHLVRTC